MSRAALALAILVSNSSSMTTFLDRLRLSKSVKLTIFSGCLHDTWAPFAPVRVHSHSLSWRYICLRDITTNCHAGASHPGCCTGARISLRYEISHWYYVNQGPKLRLPGRQCDQKFSSGDQNFVVGRQLATGKAGCHCRLSRSEKMIKN